MVNRLIIAVRKSSREDEEKCREKAIVLNNRKNSRKRQRHRRKTEMPEKTGVSGEEEKVERKISEKRKRDTHEWYCCWMKLNSSLILSQVSATVNFSPPAAPPLPPPPCKEKKEVGETKGFN